MTVQPVKPARVQVSRTPASDGVATRSGLASEKRQGTKSREVGVTLQQTLWGFRPGAGVEV